MKKRDRVEKIKEYKKALIKMLPVLLMVGIVPLLVRAISHETQLVQYPWFSFEAEIYEFFLIPKSYVLMVLMIAMAVLVAVRIWKAKGKIAFTKVLIPLCVYALLSVLSACFSLNKDFSFWGGYEQFETIWVLLSYVLVVYYVFLFAQSREEMQVVVDAICLGTTVIGVIGTFQGIGLDLFASKLGQKLITSEETLKAVGGELTVNFGENQAYATLYNTNYLGVFGSFILPFLAVMLLISKDKWRRIWYFADFVLLTIAMISSRSRAGLIAAGVVLVIALILSSRVILKWWYIIIPAINFAVVLLLLVNAYNDNVIFDRLQNILKKDDTIISETMTEEGYVVRQSGLTELYTTKDGVVICYNGEKVQITLNVDDNLYGIFALNEKKEQVALDPNEQGTEYMFETPALKNVKVAPIMLGQILGLNLTIDGKEWNFFENKELGKYQYVTTFYKASDMIMAEAVGFEEYQRLFSGRGYIWSRTIPLLKDYFFVGCGPDAFLLAFPQEDYLMMYKNGFEGMVMTKPHSMYLQIGVQTGVLSLVCILVFYIWYAVQSIKLYAFRKLGTQVEAFGMAAFIGSIGYMISGISNDSMVVTAPVFWGMIGLGVAANVMVQKARKEEAALKPVAVSTVSETEAEAKEEAVSTENETAIVKEAEKEEVKDNASEIVKEKEPAKKQTGGNKKKKR